MTQDPTAKPGWAATLDRLQAEISEWHREQFPDVPFEAIERKLRAELKEYEYARTMFLARRSHGNEQRLLNEAADVLIVILADLSRLPGGRTFSDGLAAKWPEVRARDYRGES